MLWNYMLQRNVKIHFAHRTFQWNNEARSNAAVHCVIISFAPFDTNKKTLFDYLTPKSEPHKIEVKNISPYLIDSGNVLIPTRRSPLCDVPKIIAGNKPNDGGHLILSNYEKETLISIEPQTEKFIRRFVGSQECESGVEMTDKQVELVRFSCDGKSTDSTISACLSHLRYSI
jgi:hypothetical protein